MKNLLTILFFPLLIIGCKTQENVPVKENPPTVFTKAASDVSLFSATLNGEVTEEGFTAATDRGFVYSDKNTNPSVSDTKVQSGYGKGVYLVKVDKLALNTKYYFKAYSTNTKGTAYGEVQSFTTADYKLPTAVTDVPKNVTFCGVLLSGSVKSEDDLIVSQRGFCYSVNLNPTISDNKVISGEGIGVFSYYLDNLKDKLKYYVRAFAINSKGISYGNEQIFTTTELPVRPRSDNTIVVEVKSKTGKIWMDRNLGATRVATSSTDEASYGDLYQWGRGADGHQIITSNTTRVFSNTDVPGNNLFIRTDAIRTDGYSNYWRVKIYDTNLWQGVNGINNPCPSGYRIPTANELTAEALLFSSSDRNGAFASVLKLPLGGGRMTDGSIRPGSAGQDAVYWSSTISKGGSFGAQILVIQALNITYPDGTGGGGDVSIGASCRCIKD